MQRGEPRQTAQPPAPLGVAKKVFVGRGAISKLRGRARKSSTETYAAHATATGIHLDSLHVDVEADIDLNGFLHLRLKTAGLRNVRVTVVVKADASDSDLEQLLDITRRASPVYDTVSDAVPIDATVARA